MFGYVTVCRPDLKIRDEQTYQAYYCGLCRALKKRYGLSGQSTLSYDMTFVCLLLSSLYETPTQELSTWCVIHPRGRRPMMKNTILEYGADMNLLLAYYNLLDDWQDEKKWLAKLGSDLIKKKVRLLEKNYPRQTKAVKDYISEISAMEKAEESDPDRPAGATGRMLSELLVYQEDIWSPQLRKIGFYLGKFIYWMDAYEDLEKDIRKNNFNPWIRFGSTRPAVADKVQEALTQVLSEVAYAFESLPIVENEDILRNILYAGVWTRFDEISRRDKEALLEKKAGGEPHGL